MFLFSPRKGPRASAVRVQSMEKRAATAKSADAIAVHSHLPTNVQPGAKICGKLVWQQSDAGGFVLGSDADSFASWILTQRCKLGINGRAEHISEAFQYG
eukprot:6018988-Amphidinium_carterae.1